MERSGQLLQMGLRSLGCGWEVQGEGKRGTEDALQGEEFSILRGSSWNFLQLEMEFLYLNVRKDPKVAQPKP